MLEEIEGESVLWKYQLPSKGLSDRFKPKIFYVLTARRAMIVEANGNNLTILKQCQLENVLPTLMNANTKASFSESEVFKQFKGEERIFGASKMYGDILFIEEGVVKLRFDSAQDPDDVINLINVIKKQKVKSSVSNGKATTSGNEVEIWDSGPLVSRIQFGETKGIFNAKFMEIHYAITNKRAYIIGDGKIRRTPFGWAKLVFGWAKLVSGLLVVPENWNGGIIAECNLLEVEPVILRRRRWKGPPIETYDPESKESREFGDIAFVGRDKILLTFKDVENPDDVIKLIRYTFSSDMA
jgi:hypothetical protein